MTYILVFDTETTTDTTQRLIFGAFRYCHVVNGNVSTLAEGIIYADELPDRDPDGYANLQRYAAEHRADVDLTFHEREPNQYLEFVSRDEFAKRWLWHVGYERQETIVGFNLPFDLTRLAVDVGEARGDFQGGFSLTLFRTLDGRADTYKPRLTIKMLDSKKSFIRYTAHNQHAYYQGSFVDCRTLAFALTNRSHSLASACQTFSVEHGKIAAAEHGHVTGEYVAYCLRDVQATAELFAALLAELTTHGLDITPDRVYSPASLAKAYFRAMNLPRLLDRADASPEHVNDAMSAFYGARSEVRIRRTPMPVAQLDFSSMYPTVNTLMRMWRLLTCARIEARQASEEVQSLLDTVTLNAVFEPSIWPRFVGIAKVRPAGDILPVRAKYSGTGAPTIGINHLTADDGYWYAIPDLVASALLTRRAPRIDDAVLFEPVDTSEHVRPVTLRGMVPINPRHDDFFSALVEQRADYKGTPTGDFLKVLANSGCYGIFAELNTDTGGTEVPGPYTYPPIASCITAAARLMLAMLERCVTDARGSWVFTDTDSMAIVASESVHEISDVQTLSYVDVNIIRRRFNRLNPYANIPHLLKLEYTGWCYAISAKRYALYHVENGNVVIDKNSEHGLGHLLDPTHADSDDPQWMRQLWQYLITRELFADTAAEPAWLDRPAISRYSVTQYSLLKSFGPVNQQRTYADRIKPANFILIAHAHQMQPWYRHKVVPIAPYEPDPSRWTAISWYNKHRPKDVFDIDTLGDMAAITSSVYVQSYRDVADAYVIHPEPKFAEPNGQPCHSSYRGPLHRRHIRAIGTGYVGKESNEIERVQKRLTSADEVMKQRLEDDWPKLFSLVTDVLRTWSLNDVARSTGIPRRTVGYILAGRTPSPKRRNVIVHLAATVAADEAGLRYTPGDTDPLAVLTYWADTIGSQLMLNISTDADENSRMDA